MPLYVACTYERAALHYTESAYVFAAWSPCSYPVASVTGRLGTKADCVAANQAMLVTPFLVVTRICWVPPNQG